MAQSVHGYLAVYKYFCPLSVDICLSFDSFSKLIDVSSENHLTQEEGSSKSSSLHFSSPNDLTSNLLSSSL